VSIFAKFSENVISGFLKIHFNPFCLDLFLDFLLLTIRVITFGLEVFDKYKKFLHRFQSYVNKIVLESVLFTDPKGIRFTYNY